MSDLSYRLTELRSALVPVSQFAAWPVFFLLTSAISLQVAYFLALALVLVADIFDSSTRTRGLVRDTVAGATTAFLALVLNNPTGATIGAIVASIALADLFVRRVFEG
ncbi:MAG TPA: hypothetical protein VE955_05610 [Candidatus Dormibacteraeota bacterium]|jgi:hypothetical protein|nr:hypothetical protein [Candidatus Dormibacteraeota bacterium]